MPRLNNIKCFVLDMDGTFYLGNRLLPGALEFMRYLAASGRDYLFLTNNSSCSANYYAGKLSRMGWPTSPDDVLTSGEATAIFLHRQKAGAKVFLLGTPELEQEFTLRGLALTEEQPDFVVLGFDKTLTYRKLELACHFIRNGVPFIATHPDFNCPTEDGYIPDCGAMIELIKASTGVSPQVIGKPNKEIISTVFAKRKYPAEQLAVVGDRIYTDIATAKNAGVASVLVLSGETKADDLTRASVVPDFVFANLGELATALAACDNNG